MAHLGGIGTAIGFRVARETQFLPTAPNPSKEEFPREPPPETREAYSPPPSASTDRAPISQRQPHGSQQQEAGNRRSRHRDRQCRGAETGARQKPLHDPANGAAGARRRRERSEIKDR